MSPDRPNVMLIMVDQWPGNLLGIAGHPVIETPTIDHLASLGTYYPNTYAECPICIPSRRSVMTGTTARVHGDRVFQPAATMPDLPTLAQTFRDAGYQATAVGKLHVFPQRDRIGFDDTILAEEGRSNLGAVDDYEIYLAEQGLAGRQFEHGMCNNDYLWRAWHLDEEHHVTNWTTREMVKAIKRRDPTRPAFWHLSYTHPHPPITPLPAYFERYARRTLPSAAASDWSEDFDALPHALKTVRDYWPELGGDQLDDARRAFYAQCTHIDHQLRLVLGSMREEGVLDDTIIMLTGDHGDMLADHGLYAKRVMLDGSARVPMVLVGAAGTDPVAAGSQDHRLVGLNDIMPTLLCLAGIDVPDTCDGLSIVGREVRDIFYGEALEGDMAMRMVRDERFKLIWYPAGNAIQLFDLQADPQESDNRADDSDLADVRKRLERELIARLYGGDEELAADGHLVGSPAPVFETFINRGLSGQRGLHYPPPPLSDASVVVGTPKPR